MITKAALIKCIAVVLTSAVLLACEGPLLDGMQPGEERAVSTEAETTALMIESIKAISLQRYPAGKVKRFNQSKSLGCLDAEFAVAEDIPERLRQGIFSAPRIFPARIRFANATKQDDREKDFRGMSIKLFDVPGVLLWGEPGQQDFVLNSYPALFAANPADFLEFIEANRTGKVWTYFIRPSHFYSLKVIMKGRKKADNPFTTRFWSTTPYRFGDDATQAVKYSARPCPSMSTVATVAEHSDFLTDAMSEHLKEQPACFEFMVQFQTNPETMPIENAAVIWDENESSFIKVATITINNQDFTSTENFEHCEAMEFNPWQSLPAHRPIGGINRVRKPVYAEISAFRRSENARR